MKAEENPAILLANIPVEFRDATGRVIRTTVTDGNGSYVFPNMAQSGYIHPAENRNERASGTIKLVTPDGSANNFTVLGVKARLIVLGEPGTFVLVSTFPITGNPPTIDHTKQNMPQVVSTTIGLSTTVMVAVRSLTGYLTCWKYSPATGYTRSASQSLNGGAPLNPQAVYNAVCP